MKTNNTLRHAVNKTFNVVNTKAVSDVMVWTNLSILTYKILQNNLVNRYGNILSAEHEECLTRAAGECAALALGKYTGRKAFGLDTGFGKTELVVAFLTAVHRLKLDDLSVMVCQFKVEALCELKRKLRFEGVPDDKIGLVYSPTAIASEPSTPANEQRQFQLVTHNRVVDHRCDIIKQNTYNDKPRSLVIWDESFLKSEVKNIPTNDLTKAIDNFATDHKHLESHIGLIAWLRSCQSLLSAEEVSQQVNSEPLEVNLNATDPNTLSRFTDQVDHWKTYGASRKLTEHQKTVLKELLSMANSPIRLTVSGTGENLKGQSVISYRVAVPESFTSMVILDASVTIRDLVSMDDTVTIETRNMVQKQYDSVTIHQLIANGGRESMTNDFGMKAKEDRNIAQEIIAVIKSRPDNESFIIFTYKPNDGDVNFEQILRSDMSEARIDSYSIIDDKPRFNFLTFGSETSLNGFSYCTNVIMAGVLHLRPEVIDGFIIGQRNDLTHAQNLEERKRVDVSEKVHRIYQALSRGSCRGVNNGLAFSMNAWIIHRDLDIRLGLSKRMAGVKWVNWDRVTDDNSDRGNSNKLSLDILSHLEATPVTNFPLSIRSLKADMGIDSDSTWTRALATALDLSDKFYKVDRSIHME